MEPILVLDPDLKEVKINKVWLYTIPEFKRLLTRDKGSPGDAKGEFKKKATKEFTFIYYYSSFMSLLRTYKEDEKMRESLAYSGLVPSDIDKDVKMAIAKFEEMQLAMSRPYRSYKAVLKGLDALDQYYEDIDFTLKDKMGKLLNDPSAVTKNIKSLDEAYTALKNLEIRVEEDLTNGNTGIRGKNELGLNEGKVREWSEADIAAGSSRYSTATGKDTSYDALMLEVQGTTMDKGKKIVSKEENYNDAYDDDGNPIED